MSAGTQAKQSEERPNPPSEATKDALGRFDWMPCHLTLEIPITDFSLGELLRLDNKSVVATSLPITQDVPLRANGLLIAWIHLEPLGDHLAARITDLA